MIDSSLRVLRTDVSATPIEWIGVEDAVKLYSQNQVVYPMGNDLCSVRGGICAKTGLQSRIEVHSIICTQGRLQCQHKHQADYTPPLNNNTLFRRDANLCLYCGRQFKASDLSRDHVIPLSRGGNDNWTNVVTACKRCNHFKSDRTPEESGLQLIAVPFTPTHAEYIYLSGRKILADQMEFLVSHFPRNSLMHERIKAGSELLHSC